MIALLSLRNAGTHWTGYTVLGEQYRERWVHTGSLDTALLKIGQGAIAAQSHFDIRNAHIVYLLAQFDKVIVPLRAPSEIAKSWARRNWRSPGVPNSKLTLVDCWRFMSICLKGKDNIFFLQPERPDYDALEEYLGRKVIRDVPAQNRAESREFQYPPDDVAELADDWIVRDILGGQL